MAIYEKQNKIDDIHVEVQKEVKAPERNVVKSIPSNVLLFVGIAVILILYFAMNKGWNMNKTFFIVTAVAALAILLAMNQKGNRLLTEQECKVELYKRLQFKQRNKLGEFKELPDGRLKTKLVGRLRFLNGQPWKRQLNFSILANDGLEYQYTSELNPYSGDIISIYEGYHNPADKSDIIYVLGPEGMAEKRYTEFGGKPR